MALTFPNYKSAYYSAADFLDGVSSFSFAGWFRLDTVTAGSRQYVWSHYGSTNRISLRKNNGTPELWRWAVVSGGVTATVDDTTGAPVAGTVYHIAGSWIKNTVGGLKIYRNGAWVASTNTTTQTSDYHSGGGVACYLAARSYNSDFGKCTLEGISLWPGVVLTADQIAALYYGLWPHQLALAAPAVHWIADGHTLTAIRDLSGYRRHVTAVDTTVTDGGLIGRYEDPSIGCEGTDDALAAGPAPPASWTLWEEVDHPTVTSTVTGLSNGTTYEFHLHAINAYGDESIDSATVECTPVAVTTVHVKRKLLRGF